MIVIDAETTDLIGNDGLPIGKQPHIIELAIVKLDDETLEEKGRFDALINPGIPISKEITKITGIKDEDVADCPPFAKFLPEICEITLGERIVVAHNCEFDCSVLEHELRRMGKVSRFPWPPIRKCTVELTLHIKGYRLGMKELYAEATGGGEFPNAHRAINDVLALCTSIRWMRKSGLI